jgi:hypothetical protein
MNLAKAHADGLTTNLPRIALVQRKSAISAQVVEE